MSKLQGTTGGEGDGKQGSVATDRGSGKANVPFKVIRLSGNLELAINGNRTEVAINRTDDGSWCLLDIEVRDGELVVVHFDPEQTDY